MADKQESWEYDAVLTRQQAIHAGGATPKAQDKGTPLGERPDRDESIDRILELADALRLEAVKCDLRDIAEQTHLRPGAFQAGWQSALEEVATRISGKAFADEIVKLSQGAALASPAPQAEEVDVDTLCRWLSLSALAWEHGDPAIRGELGNHQGRNLASVAIVTRRPVGHEVREGSR